MIKIEADTLEELYEKSTKELCCSVTELDIDIIQKPSSFLGLFSKKAIAIVGIKEPSDESNFKYKTAIKDSKNTSKTNEAKPDKIKEKIKENKQETVKEAIKEKKDGNSPEAKAEKYSSKNKIKDSSIEANDILEDIYYSIAKVIDKIPLDVEVVEVKMIDKHTVYIKLDGEDASLIIGKHAYRYKALSYLIYSWIHGKYDLLIKLEVSNFIKKQEVYVLRYLEGIIEKVETEGFATTKSFDGILMHVAVNHLRDTFPNKNVMILKNKLGDRYIKVHLDRE